MSKRKRDHDDSGTTKTREPGLGRQYANLRATIPRCTKTLYNALKLARGFERQKLGRRQKDASDQPKNLLRLREEVIVLKQLDLEKTANNYLLRRLSKAKRVRESKVFEDVYGSSGLEAPQPGAEANVVGRLVNSAPVKEAMPGIMETVYEILELKDLDSPERVIAPTAIKVQPDLTNTTSLVESDFEGFSPPASIKDEEEEEQENEEDSSSMEKAYRHRSTSPEEYGPPYMSKSETSSRSPSPQPLHPTKKTPDVSFLPSLNMAAYYSGSDSGSEEDADAAAKPRKNRRGQRARQQIAEQKYGRTAKHLQTQNARNSKDTGWDIRRGAVSRSDDRRAHRTNGSSRQFDSTRESKPKPVSRDDAGPLHPSWEAAKLRKSQPVEQAKFSGKKITFG